MKNIPVANQICNRDILREIVRVYFIEGIVAKRVDGKWRAT